MASNVDHARKTIQLATGRMPGKRECGCAGALGPALVTDMSTVPAEQKKKLNLLLKKYI